MKGRQNNLPKFTVSSNSSCFYKIQRKSFSKIFQTSYRVENKIAKSVKLRNRNAHFINIKFLIIILFKCVTFCVVLF